MYRLEVSAQPPYFFNRLLASLPAADIAALQPHLKTVELPQEAVLFEAGDAINRVYFPHSGIISLVVGLTSGELIETAMIGCESLVGGSSALGGPISINKAVVQIAGAATTLDSDRLRNLADANTAFRTALINHEQLIMIQAQQSAACNAAHAVEARLSRRLLRCRDLVGGNDLQLTQEYLAQMLGVRRTSVSIVANTLQKAGLIRYSRGHIRLLDIESLRESACECYEAVKLQSERLIGPTLVKK